ncbi:hypothetical protein KY495_11700 [Massilia sp. PAMC28688]|uniref:hypothetical protein n=1 Tax=Massilia sp. PAMC28688 TaxID=2861283 RepID=UPI001C638FF7|nr:hypothetical protein [Massilia sp. PAMC28688]QYF95754.1 hypothetical protein KY495_11700 [Massilia sp. PAMC28688]
MQALSTLTRAAVSGVWKLAAVVLLIVLVLTAAGMGYHWHLAARDRDAARVELVAERAKSASLAAAITRQNEAIDALASEKAQADARGQAALQLAAANGKRFDQALARTRAAKATTCTEAMPAVNDVLESIR